MNATLQAGQRYLATYPDQKKLGLFMPDYRLIRLVKLASRFMPAFSCFAILWQYFFADPSQSILANAVITSLFALSLPYQGLYWLGKRAASPLPLSLLGWYQELKQKLINENKKVEDQAMPSYQDFANLLQLAEQTWGNEYFDKL
ncbi:membrane protein [Actinobacillus lignieresii]|uniref:terminus macrodomain insulation protein YfbV n=1 Tax=Actinobacillus lignieresii TaxID=720 RepID=UPI000F6D9AF5|nr:terminus macrodomain insulation protein YfbV [Actinobacillus lignieresii]VEB25619.1 membrane protein [Actinobacillus lignieresii]